MPTAREWKEFYRSERAELGDAGLIRLLDAAAPIELPRHGAVVFPHTRLSGSGHLPAAAANGVLKSGCERVLALGALHRRVRCDESQRRVYGPEVDDDEFSLDNFAALVQLAARRAGRRPPELIARYPFLTGDSPRSLAGFEELAALVRGGAALVATTDPIHHGDGYGTPKEQQLPRDSAETKQTAEARIGDQLDALSRRDYPAFLQHAERDKSDFRDAGPVLAELLPEFRWGIQALELVDYADVLAAPPPTWVAAALMHFNQHAWRRWICC